MKSEVPFGPFIIFATVFVYFAHLDFASILALFA
jgi:prepilin signal peptidase PulO-like enzyme (type II secretory pathway)